MALPSEQQPGETDKAFAAFTLYLNLGPKRSLAAVAKALGRSTSFIGTWSSKYHWLSRIPQSQRRGSRSASGGEGQGEEAVSHTNSLTAPAPSALSPCPWEQQPGESCKAFAAFTAYLSLGPGRSLSKTAKATNRTKNPLARWSMRWQWRARAAAYQAHLAGIERKATEQLVAAKSVDWANMHQSVRRQAWAEGEDLIALAQDFKTRWRESDQLPGFGAVVRALELAFKLKQFAAGMASEVKEVNTTVTGADGGPVRVEVAAALRKIYGQPLPGEVVDVKELPPAPAPAPKPLSGECALCPPTTQSAGELSLSPPSGEGWGEGSVASAVRGKGRGEGDSAAPSVVPQS